MKKNVNFEFLKDRQSGCHLGGGCIMPIGTWRGGVCVRGGSQIKLSQVGAVKFSGQQRESRLHARRRAISEPGIGNACCRLFLACAVGQIILVL